MFEVPEAEVPEAKRKSKRPWKTSTSWPCPSPSKSATAPTGTTRTETLATKLGVFAQTSQGSCQSAKVVIVCAVFWHELRCYFRAHSGRDFGCWSHRHERGDRARAARRPVPDFREACPAGGTRSDDRRRRLSLRSHRPFTAPEERRATSPRCSIGSAPTTCKFSGAA